MTFRPIHNEVNEDSASFQALIDAEFARQRELDAKPRSYIPEEEKTDSMLIDEMLAADEKKQSEEDQGLKNTWSTLKSDQLEENNNASLNRNKFSMELPIEKGK